MNNKFKVGDEVVFIDTTVFCGVSYPIPGTHGIVQRIRINEWGEEAILYVQWEAGSVKRENGLSINGVLPDYTHSCFAKRVCLASEYLEEGEVLPCEIQYSSFFGE